MIIHLRYSLTAAFSFSEVRWSRRALPDQFLRKRGSDLWSLSNSVPTVFAPDLRDFEGYGVLFLWWWVDPWNAHAHPLLGCRHHQPWFLIIRSGGGCWGLRSGVRKREFRKGSGGGRGGAGELDHQMVSSIVLPTWSVLPSHQPNQQHRSSGVVICSAKHIPPCCSPSFQQLRHPFQMKAFAPICRASSSVKSDNVLSMPSSLARFVCLSVHLLSYGWLLPSGLPKGFTSDFGEELSCSLLSVMEHC